MRRILKEDDEENERRGGGGGGPGVGRNRHWKRGLFPSSLLCAKWFTLKHRAAFVYGDFLSFHLFFGKDSICMCLCDFVGAMVCLGLLVFCSPFLCLSFSVYLYVCLSYYYSLSLSIFLSVWPFFHQCLSSPFQFQCLSGKALRIDKLLKFNKDLRYTRLKAMILWRKTKLDARNQAVGRQTGMSLNQI